MTYNRKKADARHDAKRASQMRVSFRLNDDEAKTLKAAMKKSGMRQKAIILIALEKYLTTK